MVQNYWLINYIPEPIKKNSGSCEQTKLWVFLKQKQPKIIVIQSVSTSCTEVERNHGNQKLKNDPKKT